ncbi:unnamed protein product, partial [Ectocarpus sp. 12 AP-2014]
MYHVPGWYPSTPLSSLWKFTTPPPPPPLSSWTPSAPPVCGKASERSSSDKSATVRTHHPDDTDSGILGSAEMAATATATATAAQAGAGCPPSDRNRSRFSTEEGQPSTGTNSSAMAMSKESSRCSSHSGFDVLHHGSSGNSSNNSVYSRDSERGGDHDNGELGG